MRHVSSHVPIKCFIGLCDEVFHRTLRWSHTSPPGAVRYIITPCGEARHRKVWFYVITPWDDIVTARCGKIHYRTFRWDMSSQSAMMYCDELSITKCDPVSHCNMRLFTIFDLELVIHTVYVHFKVDEYNSILLVIKAIRQTFQHTWEPTKHSYQPEKVIWNLIQVITYRLNLRSHHIQCFQWWLDVTSHTYEHRIWGV